MFTTKNIMFLKKEFKIIHKCLYGYISEGTKIYELIWNKSHTPSTEYINSPLSTRMKS